MRIRHLGSSDFGRMHDMAESCRPLPKPKKSLTPAAAAMPS